ncbi:hypothetical protein GALL_535370 [mine drainage metagenome]|uniref:Uncharacterized protein n=1 Tax=mine drainage metagenome TaxID=410659 RepID=A0A1J5P1D5_9ZZZZ
MGNPGSELTNGCHFFRLQQLALGLRQRPDECILSRTLGLQSFVRLRELITVLHEQINGTGHLCNFIASLDRNPWILVAAVATAQVMTDLVQPVKNMLAKKIACHQPGQKQAANEQNQHPTLVLLRCGSQPLDGFPIVLGKVGGQVLGRSSHRRGLVLQFDVKLEQALLLRIKFRRADI